MPEFVTYNPLNGRIIEKYYSVDPSVVEGKQNLLEIPRDTFNALTKFHKVESGLVVLMTQAEQDALLQEEAQAIIDAENQRITNLDNLLQTDLSGMTLAKIDTTINNIGNLNDAKTFLKRFCRYIIKFIAR